MAEVRSTPHSPALKLGLGPVLAVVMVWLSFFALAIWLHAERSSQPPIYDAFTYYQKAMNVWAALHSGAWREIMSAAPNFRPPGTVLMSYPFGFSTDFRGFYFRSVFFPVALFAIALLIIAARRDQFARAGWAVLLLIGMFTTLPALYHFEPSLSIPSTPTHWGLVDNFLAGLGAVGAASMIRCARSQSLFWLFCGALIAILCIFVKPTGVFIAAFIGVIWFVLSFRAFWIDAGGVARGRWRQMLGGGAVMVLALVISLWIALRSAYLSAANFEYGNAAIAVMRSELVVTSTQIMALLHEDTGYLLPLWGVATLALVGLWRRPGPDRGYAYSERVVLAAIATLVSLFGVWFWLIGSGGGTQIRYFIPFLMLAATLLAGPFLDLYPALPRLAQISVSVLMLGPALFVAFLLALPEPPVSAQITAGINLSAGGDSPGLAPARAIIQANASQGRMVTIYSSVQSIGDATLSSALSMQMLLHPGPTYSVIRPIDWQKPSTYRLEDMADADYLLNQGFGADVDVSKVLATYDIDTFAKEDLTFRVFISGLSRADGLDLISSEMGTQLFRIDRRDLFAATLARFVSEHQWRTLFREENKKFLSLHGD